MDELDLSAHGLVNTTIRVLVISSDAESANKVRELLSKAKDAAFLVDSASSVSQGKEVLLTLKGRIDIIILEGSAAGEDPLIVSLFALQSEYPAIPIIALTDSEERMTGIEAVSCGAQDYLVKHRLEPYLLICSVNYAIERKKSEVALEQSIGEWDATFNAIRDKVALVDPKGVIVKCNRSMAEFLGEGSQSLVGRSFNDLLEQTMQVSVNDLYVNPEGASSRVTKDFDLNEFHFHVSVDPLKDSNGNLLGTVNILRDTTEHKRREEERVKLSKLESLGILAGGIAHDFNNLLAGVLGNISLALNNMETGSKVHGFLQSAEDASKRAKGLTQQLLMFSKGGMPIIKPVNIEKLLGDWVVFILRGSGIKPAFAIQENLYTVEIDKDQINQVINNLVINARQAMSEGGAIRINARNIDFEATQGIPLSPGKHIEIAIQDTGPGIPENILNKIFDPYFTTKEDGNGLGLASSYSVVEKHGGYITVDSKEGVGTTFYVYLPATAKQPDDTHGFFKKCGELSGRILIMDDEESIRTMAVRVCEEIGCQAVCTSGGAEAVEVYKKAFESGDPFNAVILDLTVPGGIGGQETVKRLLELDPNVKAIVSSGYSNDPIMADYTTYGFAGCIIKPYELDEFTAELYRVLSDKT